MRVIRLETVDSTMLEARRLMGAGETLPFAVVTERQTGGVGRHGRPWSSPPGGWWFTVAVALPAGHRTLSGTDVLTVVLALAEACEGAVEIASGGSVPSDSRVVQLKWPNDLMHGDRKLAGVLIETLVTGGRTVALVGVGVNADVEAAALPPTLRATATSLRDIAGVAIGGVVSRSFVNAVAGLIVEHVSEAHAVDLNIDLARARLWGVGRTVPITLPNGTRVSGRIDGITDDGDLLATIDGEQHVIRSVEEIGP